MACVIPACVHFDAAAAANSRRQPPPPPSLRQRRPQPCSPESVMPVAAAAAAAPPPLRLRCHSLGTVPSKPLACPQVGKLPLAAPGPPQWHSTPAMQSSPMRHCPVIVFTCASLSKLKASKLAFAYAAAERRSTEVWSSPTIKLNGRWPVQRGAQGRLCSCHSPKETSNVRAALSAEGRADIADTAFSSAPRAP